MTASIGSNAEGARQPTIGDAPPAGFVAEP
jgi:hypothetical protein